MSNWQEAFEKGRKAGQKFVAARMIILGYNSLLICEVCELNDHELKKLREVLFSDVLLDYIKGLNEKSDRLDFLNNVGWFKEILTPQVYEILKP